MEEAPVVVTAATGAIGPVVAKLSALLGRDEYKLRRRTRKDVKHIRSKLRSIHSLLWAVWEREDHDAASKELRMDAWDLADDMDDAIDDFILSMKGGNDDTHQRLKQARTQQPTEPSRPFHDLKTRADDVWERCRNKWKMETPPSPTVSSLFSRRKTSVDSIPARKPRVHRFVPPKDKSKLVGMDRPRNKLVEHLVGGEESTPVEPQIKIASIVGSAGVGKTTLAHLVYEAIGEKFKARAFVSVTEHQNMTEVLASILQQIAADDTRPPVGTNKAATEKHLIDTISDFLKDKRYLVIIDDIRRWEEWKTIRESLPNNNLGSRIVTTSCVSAITEKWCDNFDALACKIDSLDDNQVTQMIEAMKPDMVGEDFDMVHKIDHQMIDNVSEMIQAMKPDMVREDFDSKHNIVKMCGGMPLALVCMISAFVKEREHQEQQGLHVSTRDVQEMIEEQVKRNGIQNTPGFEPLVESLQLGYNDLPHHMLKTCLLYCSIYPEYHSFRRVDLVMRWIAHGFVCKQKAAKHYFDELVSRGLIFGPYWWIKMNPMMRNYLRQKLRQDNFIACISGIPSSRTGRWVCIDHWPPNSDDVEQVDPLSAVDWCNIRSLVVSNDTERVPYKHLQHLRLLDVLDNSDPNDDNVGGALENQHVKDMCELLRLRHLLGLHGEGISEIPAEIGRLRYLETLDVYGTAITRLPAEIGALKQLRTLHLSGNKGLRELPREMGNLQDLESLRIREANIVDTPWEIIGTLKELKTLEVSGNKEVEELPNDIGNLQQLETLDVSRTGITELPRDIGKLQNLESLDLGDTLLRKLPREIGGLKKLKTLDLGRTEIVELPKDIGNLQQLQTLLLFGVKTITKLPRDIGNLQNLETLDLVYTNVRKVPREIGQVKKLKNFEAHVSILPFEAGQISKLVRLPRCVHQAWKNSDLVSSLAGEILSFEQVSGPGDGGLTLGTKHMHVPWWIREHFNNVGSLDIRICKLEEQDLKVLREMPSLLRLCLRFDAVPRKPIAISREGFAKLCWLVVDSRVPRVTFQEGAMPSLVYLNFEFQFYAGPPNTDPMGIKHLVSLDRVMFLCSEWYRADSSPCISATVDVVRKEAQEHPKSKTPDGILFVVSTKGQEDAEYQRFSALSSLESNVAGSSGANEIDAVKEEARACPPEGKQGATEISSAPSSQDIAQAQVSDAACSNGEGEIVPSPDARATGEGVSSSCLSTFIAKNIQGQ